jgi:hypothetical protein
MRRTRRRTLTVRDRSPCSSGAEIRVDHARIAHRVARGAAEDRLSGRDDDDVLGDRHQHFHHVLDHQDRHPARDDAAQQIDRVMGTRPASARPSPRRAAAAPGSVASARATSSRFLSAIVSARPSR